jgi:nucleotide-binding universal stress UspA family protein
MYKKILVPLDGSQNAEAILPHAHQLAIQFKAELLFLQVFELGHLVDLPRVDENDFQALPHVGSDEMNERISEAQSYLTAVASQAADLGIPAVSRITYGPIASSIINIAVEEGSDLIAMASHGGGGLRGVYYGSVAAGVLQRVDRPLLIVRSQEPESN